MAVSHSENNVQPLSGTIHVEEHELLDRATLFDAFLQHAPAAWALLDADLRYVLVSDPWGESFELSQEEGEAASHFSMFKEEPGWKDILRKGLEGQAQQGEERRLIRRDGSQYVVDWKVQPVRRRETDQVQGVLLFVSDVTRRKRMEQRLRESEKRHRLISENTSDLICLHDSRGRFIYLSPSVEKMLGYAPDELIGAGPDEFIHPEDLDQRTSRPMLSLFGGGGSEAVRYRVRHKDGHYVWLESNVNFVSDGGHQIEHIVTSSRDVTERVQAERDKERINKELEHRNRELQDFAYVASHDLQEPLRKIRAFADLLNEDYEEAVDETGRYYLVRMQDAAARMSRLISDLLAFSRITTRAKPFQEVDLQEVMNYVISDLEIQISDMEGTITVGDLPVMHGDRTQLRQLMQNLVGNALKFRRPDARPVVTVSAQVESTFDDTTGEAQEIVRITVEDNGMGFDEKYLDRIFTPFERLHRRGKLEGTGMGLAICRRIVERHGGHITARSTPGEGSTFEVTLPKNPHNSPEKRNLLRD